MKQEVIKTKKPKLVLQVYHNYYLYNKSQKTFSDRKEFTDWKKEINSKSAFLNDGKLSISKQDYNSNILNSDLVILNDFNSETEDDALKTQNKRGYKGLVEHKAKTDGQVWMNLKQVQYFNLLGGVSRKFEIFELKKINGEIEVHLLYDLFEIGEPKRKNFKLCNLKMDIPVEVKINGKLDHSMSRGKERLYKEHCYIFHLIGETNEFELLREPFHGSLKRIPKPEKIVDLMKVLY